MYQKNPTGTKSSPPKERLSPTLLSSEIHVELFAQRAWTFLSYGFIITQPHSSPLYSNLFKFSTLQCMQDCFPSIAQSKPVSAPVFTNKGVVLTSCACLDCLKYPAAPA